MKDWTKLTNKIKIFVREFTLLFIGFSLIFGLLYLRLLPAYSRDLYQNMTQTRILLTCCTLACLAFNLYNTLKILGVISTKEPTGIKKTFIAVLLNFRDYLTGTIINVYQFFWYWIEEIADLIYKKRTYLKYHKMLPIATFCIKKNNTLFYTLLAIKFIPRIVFVSVFFIEVYFFQHLNYTFKCLPFLLIIFLEEFFLSILENFHTHYYEGIQSFLEWEPDADNPEYCLYRFKPGVDLEDLPYGAKDLTDYVIHHFDIIQAIPQIIEEYKDYKNNVFYGYHITLILQSVRLQIYLFILFYGVNLISYF